MAITLDYIDRFGFVGIVPWPLMGNWCAAWLAFTRYGTFGVVGSLDSFLIVSHVPRLVCIRSVEVMTSFQLFFFSYFMLSNNVFPVSMVVSPKGSIEY